MPINPLNIKTIQSAIKGSVKFIQDEKVRISREQIFKFYTQGRWPAEYLSYVGRVSQQTKFKDPNRFFKVMKDKPELYAKDFIFQPVRDISGQLAEATRLVNSIVDKQARLYVSQPDSVVTGHYQSRFMFRLDGSLIRNYSQFDNADGDSQVQIYNTALYAGTIEKNALYYTKIGGVLFHAAKVIQKAYPDLGVEFSYWDADRVPGTTSYYQIPMLRLGGKNTVTDSIKRPGKNHRKTGRKIRRRARGNLT
jgi:hypothetical protein